MVIIIWSLVITMAPALQFKFMIINCKLITISIKKNSQCFHTSSPSELVEYLLTREKENGVYM